MKKLFVIMVTGGLVFLSCKVEMPSKPPDWYFTVNVPLGDTTFYMMDFSERAGLDTIDDILMVTKDSTVYDIPIGNISVPFVEIPICFDITENIDTAESSISSRLASVKLGTGLHGEIYDTTNITVTLKSPWRAADTIFVIFYPLEDTTPIDTTVNTCYHDVPLNPYTQFYVKAALTLHGQGTFDSIRAFYEFPMHFTLLGDTLCTETKEIKVGDDIINAVKDGRLKTIKVHTRVGNGSPIETSLSSMFYSIDYQDTVALLDDMLIPKYISPIEPSNTSITVELNKKFINLFADSLVYYRSKIIFPPQVPETTKVSPHDYINVGGHISATIFTNFKGNED
jgi:hypothetical protein